MLSRLEKAAVYVFMLMLPGLFSCGLGGDKTKELETRLDSAVSEIENIKQKTQLELLEKEGERNQLLDSLRLVSGASNQDLSILSESLKSSVFLVYTSNDDDVFQGSAFLIDTEGTL